MEKDYSLSVFNIIGVSIHRAITRLFDANQTSSKLALAFAQSKAGSCEELCFCDPCREVYKSLEGICLDNITVFRNEFCRHILVSGISIFDFFLADVVKFCLSRGPSHLSGEVLEQRRKRGEAERYSQFVDWIARKHLSTHRRRLDFLALEFDMKLEEKLVSGLLEKVDLRNQVVHHSSFYSIYFHDVHGLWAEPQAPIVVSWKDAMETVMLVAEVSDAILLGTSKRLFGHDPEFRLLTPAVIETHEAVRSSWDLKSISPNPCNEVVEPGWSICREGETEFIASRRDLLPYFWISVVRTKERDVFFISIIGHKYWGRCPLVSVDGGKRVEVKNENGRKIVEKMRRGRWILVEYYNEPDEKPLFARFSLEGLKEVWLEYFEGQKILGMDEEAT